MLKPKILRQAQDDSDTLAEDDVQNGRVESMQKSFDDLRESLVDRKNENV